MEISNFPDKEVKELLNKLESGIGRTSTNSWKVEGIVFFLDAA